MNAIRFSGTIVALFIVGMCAYEHQAQGQTITVCWDGSGDYLTIQEGIDAAADGYEVVVCDGTYTGPGNRDIDFTGKAITVRSENGPDNCIIDCEGSSANPHRGFTFRTFEGDDSVVTGFTITNGYGLREEISGEMLWVGGAIFCRGSNPTIRSCVIANNIAGDGGGIYCWWAGPTITNCTIVENEASYGGGIYCSWNSSVKVTDCTISGNQAYRYGSYNGAGGGIFCASSGMAITNCTISGNATDGPGGGVYLLSGSPMISNSVITWNSAGESGGGILCDGSDPEITNCTFGGNSASEYGGAICVGYDYYSTLTIANCILWGDSAPNGPGIALRVCASPSELAISYSDVEGGPANVYSEPGCLLDWGDGNIDADPLFVDPDNGDYRLLPGSPCIDAGDNDAVPPGVTTDLDGNPRFVDDPATPDTGNGTPPIVDMGAYEYQAQGQTITVCWDGSGDYLTIQEGIDASTNGDEVVVCDGTYTGPGNRDIDFTGKAITVRSENGPENCIIDCEGSAQNHHQGFRFDSGETDTSVLNGFTITNGYTPTGGGIFCDSDPLITNCIITGNTANFGGGIRCAHTAGATIRNCNITGNTAYNDGGGVYFFNSSPVIINCTIRDNSAWWWGGGIYCEDQSSAAITNCTISGNAAANGGGVYLRDSSPTVTNCILWGDSPEEIHVFSGSSVVTYSNVQGGFAGEGNIDADPLFVAGYYLAQIAAGQAEDSPCLDAGDPASAMVVGTTRTDGVQDAEPVDMGYHYPGPACPGLGDLDGDGDVDLDDYAVFADCMAGPGLTPSPTPPVTTQDCLDVFDFDVDEDVDLLDFAVLQERFTVPSNGGTDTLLTGFEGYANGAEVMFRAPRFSGSTSFHLTAEPNVRGVTDAVAPFGGSKSYSLQWQFVDATAQRWVRVTTFDAANLPNPTIELDKPIRLRLRLDSGSLRVTLGVRETGTTADVGQNGGTAGTIEWVGAASQISGAPQGVLLTGQPGVWQTLVFDPVTDPVLGFTGDGNLSSPTGKGTVEHLAFSSAGTAGPFTVYIDDIEQLSQAP